MLLGYYCKDCVRAGPTKSTGGHAAHLAPGLTAFSLLSVEYSDFLSAIELTWSYYLSTAPGNKNGLPDDPLKLKKVVGGKMRGDPRRGRVDTKSVSPSRKNASQMKDETRTSLNGRGVYTTFQPFRAVMTSTAIQ